MTEAVDQFARWLARNASTLKRRGPQKAADKIQAQLSRINEGLAVEIAQDTPNWELVFSAEGDPSLFDLVEEIGQRVCDLPGWNVQALKPARGFDFEFRNDDIALDASTLHFEPLESDAYPGEIGIRLLVPDGIEVTEEEARSIVEHGIGERSSSSINHLEVAASAARDEDALPIEKLGQYLSWKAERRLKSES